MKAIAASSLKPWLHRIGTGLGIAGVLFVGLKLRSYSGDMAAANLGFPAYLGMLGLAVVYGAANLLLALAWHAILAALGVSVARRWAIRTYATSQLAKYVPGNVFQFAGRQAIGAAAGLPNWPLAKSTGLELGLIALAGASFATLVLPAVSPTIGGGWGAALFLAAALVLIGLGGRLGGTRIAEAMVAHLAFLTISGGVFVATLALVDGMLAPERWSLVLGSYVIAWLAGLLTPGAPAGLGVREAVLIYLLKDIGGHADILLAVVVGRAVTVCGDFLFYAGGRFSAAPLSKEAR